MWVRRGREGRRERENACREGERGSGEERGSVRETTWRGGCEEEKERASAGAGDRGEQCHGSTTCSRPRLGERSVGPHAPHSSRCPCRSCPCSCRASPCHLLLALDYVVLRLRRPSRARWQARVDTKGERRHESRRHASVPSPIPRWPRRSRSHGRRRAATRAGGGRVSSDVYVLESDVVSCCLCLEECVLRSFSFWPGFLLWRDEIGFVNHFWKSPHD